MSTVVKNLGTVTAYKYAKNAGYEGTEEEFAEGLKKSAEYAENAEASAEIAVNAKTDAETARDLSAQWATGETSGTPTATNNAKYYSDQASDAQEAAENAREKAEDAQEAAEAAQAATEALEWAGLGLVVVDGALCAKYLEG